MDGPYNQPAADSPVLQQHLVTLISPHLLREGHQGSGHHRNQSPLSGKWEDNCLQSCTRFCRVCLASVQHTLCSAPSLLSAAPPTPGGKSRQPTPALTHSQGSGEAQGDRSP